MNHPSAVNLDFAPTFLDLAGAEIPTDLQGRSMRPLLEGDQVDDWRTSMFYHYYEYPHGWHSVKRHYGVRTDRYKLIHYYNDIDDIPCTQPYLPCKDDPTQFMCHPVYSKQIESEDKVYEIPTLEMTKTYYWRVDTLNKNQAELVRK